VFGSLTGVVGILRTKGEDKAKSAQASKDTAAKDVSGCETCAVHCIKFYAFLMCIFQKYPAGKISIYFGSQTGTAEGFARTLMEEGKTNGTGGLFGVPQCLFFLMFARCMMFLIGFSTKTVDLEDFDPEVLKTTDRAIFLMATYGEGEPTDNAIAFTKWMKNTDETLNSDTLNKLRFCVFGLGNKQYEHYNLMGKTTNTCLEALGGTRMFDYGEGDDDATLEEDFDGWRAQLWPALTAAFHPDAAAVEEANQRTRGGSFDVPSRIKLDFKAVPVQATANDEIALNKVHASTRHFFTAPRAEVVMNRELRNRKNPEEGSTRHIEINLKDVNLTYHTADNLAILPENHPDNVARLATALGYDLDHTFRVEAVPGAEDFGEFKQTFPNPCTVRDALSLYFDIQGPVKQALLKHLVPYVTDRAQTVWLMDLLSKENRNNLKRLVEEEGKNLVDLLTNELNSVKIPLSDLLHILPHIQPRYYTISSSSSVYPDVVHITVSITEYALKSGRSFVGLTSGYLKDLAPGAQKCRVFVRPSSFRLPLHLTTPVVMIGPGTGLAPMRALLQERKFLQSQHGDATSQNILFFGCKNRDVDYIYRTELESYQKEGVLTKLHTAFSRDGPKKVYVQNLMTDDATAKELVDLLIHQNAYVYVCGATVMGSDVMAAFVKILQEKNAMSAVQATTLVKDLQDMGRYVQELWTA
jgi:NADPH-ferrihemoprotein reductase